MADHSPTEIARLLGVQGATLRVWAKEYAGFLSPSAAVSGPTARRRYQDSDIALLRIIQALLRNGATHEQVRQQLASNQAAPLHHDVDPEQAADNAVDDDDFRYQQSQHASVIVLDQQPEVEALRQIVTMQGATLAVQRETLEAQQMIVASQSQVIEQQRAQLDALERGLQAARADEALALAELRRMIGKIPRWLRVLLGLGV